MAHAAERTDSKGRVSVYRHPAFVRAAHWINALCIFILIPTGLQILLAHPALYWGNQSSAESLWVQFPPDLYGAPMLPSYRDLATGRNWHFFFAWVFAINGLAYLAYLFISRRLNRQLAPSAGELSAFGATALEHAKLHFPRERAYNVIQKTAYLAVIFVLLPLMLLTGLAMSPGWNAAMPAILDFFGGRQSARTLHFIAAAGIVLFIIVHVLLVVVSGFRNTMGSMITGWYGIDAEKKP